MTVASAGKHWQTNNQHNQSYRASGHSMNLLPVTRRKSVLAAVLVGLAICGAPSRAQSATADAVEIRILELQVTVEISPAAATTWVLTQLNQVLHASNNW